MTVQELLRTGLETAVAGQMLVLAAFLLGSTDRSLTRVLTGLLAIALLASALINAMAAAGVLPGLRALTVGLEAGMGLTVLALAARAVWPSISNLTLAVVCVAGGGAAALAAGVAPDLIMTVLGLSCGFGAAALLLRNALRRRPSQHLLLAITLWWLLVQAGRAMLSGGVASGRLETYRQGDMYMVLLAASLFLSSWMLYLALTRRPPFETQRSPKYARSYLSQGDEQALRARIEIALAAEVWRDPDLDLQGLAQRIGATPRETSQVINAGFDCNFAALMARRRAEEAARLLKQRPDLSVTEVMLESGFGSKSAFHRAFRERWGLSPGDYRQT